MNSRRYMTAYESKRTSWFLDDKNVTYKPGKQIGEGTEGIIRLLSPTNNDDSAASESIANNPIRLVVKSPIKTVKTEAEFVSMHGNITASAEFLKRAYPNEGAYYYSFHTQADESITYRFVTPFVPGSPLHQFCKYLTSTYDLMMMLYCVAEELDRIHQLGIIHGDVKAQNIIVNYSYIQSTYSIHYIDFDSAYDVTDDFLVGTRSDCDYYAPERTRIQEKEVWGSPDPIQDVFSLGYEFKRRYEAADNDISPSKTDFPTFHNFIVSSQSPEPKNRPDLPTTLLGMKKDLDVYRQSKSVMFPATNSTKNENDDVNKLTTQLSQLKINK